jgi:cytochrome c556
MQAMQENQARLRASLVAIALAALVAAPTIALSQDAKPSRAERVIKYRQSVLYLLGWNIGPIAGMVKGEIPYDKDAVVLRADRLAELAPMIAEGFPPDSQAGAPTKAKAAIWQDMADFKARAAELERVTAKFAATARSGDLQQVAAGLGEVGGTCKGCHEKYRAE